MTLGLLQEPEQVVEVFREPTQEEQQAHGQWLVSRRVTVEGLGVGTVVAFNNNR